MSKKNEQIVVEEIIQDCKWIDWFKVNYDPHKASTVSITEVYRSLNYPQICLYKKGTNAS